MSARRSSFVRLLALLGALCLGGAAQAAGEPRRERILRFDVGATVNEDASLTVREDLEFIAMGVKISRGIIRGIPVRYRDENGRPIAVGLKVLSTSVDGVELPWKESNEGRGRFIRIGDPKRTLSPGVHRLSLTYRTTKQLGFFADHDELYWNVTGNDWDLPIQNASFRLALPGKSAGDGFGRVGWYAGRYGSTSSDGARLDDSRAVVTTRALQPGEGLTVVYSWPKGVVAPPQPSFGERFGDFVSAHGDAIARGLMWAGTALAAICLVWGALRARGEHSGEITVIPLFHAPRDMTPSLARRLTRGTDDFASLGAELIALAVNGALKISGDRRSGYRLEKTGGAPSDGLPAALMDTLFPSSSQEALNVTNAYRKRFEKSLELIKGDAKKRAEGNFLDRRAPLRRAYSALLAGAAAGALFLLTEAVSAEWGAVALLLGALALLSLRYARREPTLAPERLRPEGLLCGAGERLRYGIAGDGRGAQQRPSPYLRGRGAGAAGTASGEKADLLDGQRTETVRAGAGTENVHHGRGKGPPGDAERPRRHARAFRRTAPLRRRHGLRPNVGEPLRKSPRRRGLAALVERRSRLALGRRRHLMGRNERHRLRIERLLQRLLVQPRRRLARPRLVLRRQLRRLVRRRLFRRRRRRRRGARVVDGRVQFQQSRTKTTTTQPVPPPKIDGLCC